jgi:SpoVK/Ycf46/Vps4 family AAA+-type ATPase
MSELRRARESIGTRLTPRPAGDELPAALRGALENLAVDAKANRDGTVLLAGAAGPAAIRAAETLAASLGVEVRHVDLGALIGTPLGEIEKNLDIVFAEAEAAGAVLLFDEADALFGPRTDVKDSHDRYANVDTNVLLARIEAYPGLALLATNTETHIDPAFTRRLRRVIDYPPPPGSKA